MDMIDLSLGTGDVKICSDELMDEKNLMEAQTLIVEEDGSLGSVEDHSVDLHNSETLLDTGEEDDLPYQFRSSEGVTYRVVQVSGTNISTDDSSLPQIITATSTLPNSQPALQTVFTTPLNGQVYVIGPADDVYAKTNNHKPIAPRTNTVIETIRNPGVSKRDDRRRATHNAVERRRRDKINMWIMKLGKIVPECNSDSGKGFDVQQSKGGILAKAYDYITELNESNQKLVCVLRENDKLKEETDKQKVQMERLMEENAEMKAFLKQNGLISRYHEYSDMLDPLS